MQTFNSFNDLAACCYTPQPIENAAASTPAIPIDENGFVTQDYFRGMNKDMTLDGERHRIIQPPFFHADEGVWMAKSHGSWSDGKVFILQYDFPNGNPNAVKWNKPTAYWLEGQFDTLAPKR